jgi:hypothetical protein
VTVTSSLMAVLLAAGGGVIYHVSAKSVPRDAAPSLVLLVAYMTALSVSGLAHVSLHMPGDIRSSRLVHPGILGLGVGAAMIELGYLLAYRGAWPVSITPVVVNSIVATFLIPVGLMAFDEHVSVPRVVGVVLCLTGVWLLRQ